MKLKPRLSGGLKTKMFKIRVELFGSGVLKGVEIKNERSTV